MDRAQSLDRFLDRAGWGAAARAALAGDASARSYLRLTQAGQSAVLMDAPQGQADDPAQFLHVAQHLADIGLSPPRCLAQDLIHGFLLLEDLGDGILARLIAADPSRELPLLQGAVDVLIHLQSQPPALGLPDLGADSWADQAAITDYGLTAPDDLRSALTDALTTYANGPRVMILRDYHSENLLFLPHRAGLGQIGLLDFQLAQMGQPAYDLVSLLQDARRDVTTESALRLYFITQTGQSEQAFLAQYAAIGALRALRIIGVFARLARQGKPQYLTFLPRVHGQLQRNLEHPALRHLRDICIKSLPKPTQAHIESLRSPCCP